MIHALLEQRAGVELPQMFGDAEDGEVDQRLDHDDAHVSGTEGGNLGKVLYAEAGAIE